MKKTRKRRMARSSDTAHQRLDDHEKLCRIMQRETHKKIEANGKKIERLEKVVFTSTGMLIVGMATLIYGLIV